jgi:protein-S-isoprenylcysteine O-methyltransferase Ste14
LTLPGEMWMRWRVRVGYPVGAACLLLAHPTPRSIALGAAIGAAGLVIRGASAGHLRKGEQLATSGPYARVRNPLYLGSLFLATGFAAGTHAWIAVALLGTYFAVFYAPVVRREEKELRARYGAAFEDYAAHVPRFWPRFTADGNPGERFSWALYSRNREYEAALGLLGGIALLWLIMKWRV